MISILISLVIIAIIAWLVYKLPDWLNMVGPFNRIIKVAAVAGGVIAAILQLAPLV